MKALVTGGGGFLGQYIVEQLLAGGEQVRILSRGAYPELEKLGVECFRGDLKDEKAVANACKGVDTVYHTAGLPGISVHWKPYYETNVLGTRSVIEACKSQGVRKLIYTSTASVVFGGEPIEGADESLPYPENWLALYPKSKAIGEQAVLEANGQSGLLSCSIRPHLIWGPRDRQLIPRLLERARKGKLYRVGEGKNLVDIIYVENCASAHLMAADALEDGSPACGKAYFISQGEPVSCWDWIDEILALANLPPVKRSVPSGFAWRLGNLCESFYRWFGWNSEPNMTRFLVGQLSVSHYFNCSAAKRDFGFEPFISTEEGMQRLAADIANL